MAKIICAGHASCDLPFRPVDRSVFDVDTVYAEESKVLAGGDAMNNIINFYKLGCKDISKYVSVVGDDTFGKIILDYLRERDIDTSGVQINADYSSLVSVGLIGSDNERHFICYGNAASAISVEQIIDNITEDTEYIHIGSLMSLEGLEHENLKRLFAYAHDRKIKTSFDVTFDPTGEWFPKIEAGLPYTDIFFASYDEAVLLSGGLKDPEEMASFFRKHGAHTFVLKLGGDGCYATDGNETVRLPSYNNIKIVDTTGAGDGYVTGYLYGILNNFKMEECCLLGNVNGALAVGMVGSTSSTGTLDAIIDFIVLHGAFTLDKDEILRKLQALKK